MHLSIFFRSFYTWLDHRADDLSRHVTGELLRRFIHQASLVLACEHDILRPGVLAALLGEVPEALHARLCDDERRVAVEQKLTRLARASSTVIFRFELTLVRDALALAGLRAESWALFAEAVLAPEELGRLEALVDRCHDHCSTLVVSTEDVLRVDVLH